MARRGRLPARAGRRGATHRDAAARPTTDGTGGRRAARALLLAMVAMAAWAGALPFLPAAPGAGAQTPPEPRAVPAPATVRITDTGFEPLAVAVATGQSVVFTNETATDQALAESGGLFDSGTIPPGGAFTVAVGDPGYHTFATAAAPDAIGALTVGPLEIAGPPGEYVQAHLPEIAIPPVTDPDSIPGIGVSASRTRIQVMFADTTTVAQANAALADAGVTVVGAIPSLNYVLVAAPDAGVGNFDPTFAAEDSLRADPAVVAAALDLEEGDATVPAIGEDGVVAGGDTNKNAWIWTDARNADNGSGKGAGGNWGMESSRFPQAWNFLDAIRRQATPIDTLMIDLGFNQHSDLNIQTKSVCLGNVCNADVPLGPGADHATHTSGTVGATWANPLPSQPGQLRGVDGGNPVVNLYGTYATSLGASTSTPGAQNQPGWWSAAITSTYAQAIAGKAGGLWPNLRVINMSLGSVTLKRDSNGVALWGGLIGSARCGPGANDDGPSATGPCTLSTHDRVRQEVAFQGAIAQKLAFKARMADVTMVISSGNQSGQICVGPRGAVAKPAGTYGPCPSGFSVSREDTRLMDKWGFAAAALGPGDANPFVIVGANDLNRKQAVFADGNADVFAPGVDVLSTVWGGGYGTKSGTSMAAPHVAALVGYLLAAKPNLSPSQLRHLLRDYGYADVSGSTVPRIDAFNAVLGIDGAPGQLLDVNDTSVDGNRRIVRTRSGDETPDTDLGPKIDGYQVHTTGDGRIDMRDFRRYRDAVLAACADPSPGQKPSSDCPTAAQIDLDGAPDHPKKDGNLDGCVFPQGAVCIQREDDFSRFDFNGDGSLLLDHQARLPLQRDPTHGTHPAPTLAQGELFSDIELLQSWWDQDTGTTEGWRAADLYNLIDSGDVEVHADALFQGGADHVDVAVEYADGTYAPTQRISQKGKQVTVTVPVPADGKEVSVSGTGYAADGTVTSRSFTETTTLHPGSDRRTDLCAATVVAVPTWKTLFADGQSDTDVQVAVQNCDRPLGDGIEIDADLTKTDGSPSAASLAAGSKVTDSTGRATFSVKAGTIAEGLHLDITASVETDPNHEGPEQITQTVDLDVASPPRIIYRWEQVTDGWQSHGHFADAVSDYDIDYTPATGDPLVVSRSGSLQPAGDGDVRFVEHVGANEVPMHLQGIDNLTGESFTQEKTYRIPAAQRVPDRDALMSQIPTNVYQDDGSQTPYEQWEYSQATMTVDDDQVSIDHFGDLGKAGYRYDDVESPCNSIFCATRPEWDQITLVDRMQGSSIAFSDDLDKTLSFRRLPDGTFSTYQWCSAPKAFTMRGNHHVPELLTFDGSATSRFRFIATVTTDPDTTGEDLVLPESCVEPKAPVASFTRDVDTPVEGRVVHFLDTSRDDNGDIASWAWDFGDGTTSTDQDPEHRYEDDGAYRVTLTVTDGTGLTSTSTSDIEVTNGAPEISADDVTVEADQPVQVSLRMFDPSERDQEYLTLKVRWDDSQGPTYPDALTPGGATTLDLGVLPEGSRPLRLTVEDKDGTSATTVITVTVGSGSATREPTVDIESDPAPSCPYGVKVDEREQELTQEITAYRLDNDQDPIYLSPTLTAAATAQARWLRDQDRFQHEGDGGTDPLARAKAAGSPSIVVGENLVRGPLEATGALVVQKMSKPHDANLLDERWETIGVAAVDTTHGTLWVVVFGDHLDCSVTPPNFDPAVDPPDPVVEPDGPIHAEVLAAGQAEPVPTAAEPTSPDPTAPAPAPAADTEAIARPIDLTPTPSSVPGAGSVGEAPPPAGSTDPSYHPPATTDAGSPPAATAANPPTPVVALTVSATEVATGEAVTVTNRSTGEAVVEPGDGRPGVTLAPGASTSIDYLDPGAFPVTATAAALSTRAPVVVSGSPRPPVLTYTGPTNAAFASLPRLTATLTTGNGDAVSGRTVTFTIEGRVLTTTTDPTGLASATLVADLAPGAHTLVVDVPPIASGPGTSTSTTFTIGPNAPPVVDANGPYDLVLGEALHLDASGSYDPDGDPLASIQWDLDLDGEFEDAEGSATVPPEVVASVVCGGACDPATPEPVAVRATDADGGVTTATTEVRPTRDFRVALSPASATLNPGGNTSFQVIVSTTSGFTDPVQLSAPSLPPGVDAIFYPTSVVPGQTALLTLRAAPDVQEYDGGFSVRGTSGSIVHDNPGTVDVEFGLIPACPGSADVHITDAVTGAPIPGAMVWNTWPADADGLVQLRDLSLGQNNSPRILSVSVTAPEHGFASADQYIGCGVTTEFHLALTPARYGSIQAHVVVGIPDPNNHTASRTVTPTNIPIPDAYLNASPYGGTTDAEGNLTMSRLPLPFTTRMTVGATGYSSEQPFVSVADETPVQVTQALVPACTGSFDVRVRDSRTGFPLPDVTVTSFDAPGSYTTGPSGRVLITGVALGPRNSAKQVSVRATATLGGRQVQDAKTFMLPDCGNVAQVDLALTAPVPNYGSIAGQVTNSITHEPVAGITVTYQDSRNFRSATTDADGRYRMTDLLVGFDGVTSSAGTVSATPPNDTDWLPAAGFGVTITKDAEATKDLTITPRLFIGADVHVVDAANGDPVSGAVVTMYGADVPNQTTGGDGVTSYPKIPTANRPLELSAKATAPGFIDAITTVTLQPGTTGNVVEVRLSRVCAPATIQGLVRDASTNLPLPGARVDAEGRAFNVTGDDGRFRIPNLEVAQRRPTTITVTASKVGYLPASKPVTLFCGAQITVNLGTANTGSGSLSGTVTRASDGTPVAGVVVGGEWGGVATTGADGTYSFPTVPLDGEPETHDWTVSFQPPYDSGLDGAVRTATIHKDQHTTLDVALGAPAPNQRPVANPVEIDLPVGGFETTFTLTATDPDGDPLTYRITSRGPTIGLDQTWPDPLTKVWFTDQTTTEAHLTFVASDGRLDSLPADIVVHRHLVAPPNAPPSAFIAPVSTTTEGSTVTLDATLSKDTDGTIVAYDWDLDGDGQYDDATGVTTPMALPDNGQRTVRLRVTDDDGATGTALQLVTATNVSPVVDAGDDATVGDERRLQRAGSFADPGADTWMATVDWGEGGGEEPLPLDGTTFALDHTYAGGGTYTVVVEVCDDDLGCGSDTFTTSVDEEPPTTTTTTTTTIPTTTTSSTTTSTTTSTTIPTTTTSTTTSTTSTTTIPTTTTTSSTTTSTTSTTVPTSTTTSTTTPESTTTTSTSSTTTTTEPGSTTTTTAVVGPGSTSTTTGPTTAPTTAGPSSGDPGAGAAVSGVGATAATTSSLPVTGSNARAVVAAAVWSIGIGGALVLAQRRRQRSARR